MKAVGYYRFSPRPDGQNCESIETQQSRVRAYCQAHDYEIVGHHEDREASGARADNRPGLQEAIKHACRLEAVLVVYSLSRLARSTRDALNISEQLREGGASLASVNEHFDTAVPHGKLVFTILAACAELERDQIAQRTSDAMRRKMDDGQIMSSKLPVGWMRDPEDATRMIPCEHEREAAHLIREWTAYGNGASRIARKLTERGYTFRGKEWSFQLVWRFSPKAQKKKGKVRGQLKNAPQVPAPLNPPDPMLPVPRPPEQQIPATISA